jgi:hypothetical protein
MSIIDDAEVQFDAGGRAFAPLDNFAGSKLLTKEWSQNDPDGQDFVQRFNTPANIEKMASVLRLHDMPVSSQNLSWVFQRLRDSGLVTPRPATVPTNRAGKPLTQAQIKWQEYREFSEAHSMKDVRARMSTDPGYAAFVTKQREREFEGVGDDLSAVNPHIGEQPRTSEAAVNVAASKAGLTVAELQAWVKNYNDTPASRVRFLLGRGSNPTGYSQYEKSYQAAIAAGLI